MAAEILEAQPEDETLDQLPTDEAVKSPDELVQEFSDGQQTAEPSFEEELPDKYRGKSIQEVVAMHQEAERLIGTQGSEVGELRKVVDTYINSQLAAQNPPKPEPEPIDFFEDPATAVKQAIETHPEVVQVKQAAQEMKRTAGVQQLQAKHPDLVEVLQAPKFMEWVKGSPMRIEMFQRADQQYDIAAADELVSGFKERHKVVQQTVQVEEQARQQAVKQAATGGASASNTSGAKRVYRRADIIKLMKNDPDRYEALSDEIMKAYQEGRVR
jgi:hypothetical protein